MDATMYEMDSCLGMCIPISGERAVIAATNTRGPLAMFMAAQCRPRPRCSQRAVPWSPAGPQIKEAAGAGAAGAVMASTGWG